MAWTDLTFSFGSLLTATKMTQLDDNLDALAAGDAGAPEIQSEALADNITLAGNLYANGGSVYSDKNAGGSAHFWLRDAGIVRGLFYWDSTNSRVVLRKYDTDGTTVLGELKLDENNLVYGSNTVWHAGNLTTNEIIKGWINFNGTGTIAINDSYNITSITDDGVGIYTITWDTDFANANYAISGIARRTPADGGNGVVCLSSGTAPAVGSVKVLTSDLGATEVDMEAVSIIAIGDQ